MQVHNCRLGYGRSEGGMSEDKGWPVAEHLKRFLRTDRWKVVVMNIRKKSEGAG